MKAFLKDNIALVAAIALPALLALIFALSTLVVNVSVEDPKNDFLVLTEYNYGNNTGYRFGVSDDRLHVSWKPDQKDAQGNTLAYSNKPRLWRVHVPEMKIEEISLNVNNNKPQEISIPGITDVKVQNITPGPDGYNFSSLNSYDRNIMNEIFASGPREEGSAIIKDGRVIKVKIPGYNYHYGSAVEFVGWIVEEK